MARRARPRRPLDPRPTLATATTDRLTSRELNRATLERQLLLRRSELPVSAAVQHLIGLQAQEPRDPYTALWSRLAGFRPRALSELLETREVVRTAVMRSTVHLVTADDCLLLRPLMQPVLAAELARYRDLRGVDVAAVLAFARERLEERPLTGAELRGVLAERFPDHDAADLAYACRNLLVLVQVPPRGLWGKSGQVRSTTAESWLGRPVVAEPSLEDVVLRYFAAFGPATVADVAAWSRLTGLREVVERLRRRLRAFRDDRGREVFDLPAAPRPDPDMPAPTRFLPEYDNVLLSHADRSRFFTAEQRARVSSVIGRGNGTVLHEGFLLGVWQLERDPETGGATLVVKHVERLTKRAERTVAAEGRRFLRFTAADADCHDVRFAAVA
jgi:DNA glycosylase AlkZ-like